MRNNDTTNQLNYNNIHEFSNNSIGSNEVKHGWTPKARKGVRPINLNIALHKNPVKHVQWSFVQGAPACWSVVSQAGHHLFGIIYALNLIWTA